MMRLQKIILIICVMACASMKVWAQNNDRHNFEMAKQLDIFNAIYKNLDMLYVDTLKPKETIETGINAMLRSLDPYTVYYPENETKDLRHMLQGQYAGIGSIIRYNLKEGCCAIEEPFADTPSSRAGLRKGDLILSIDDSTMVGKMTSYVSSHLKGEPGTSFMLKIRRPTTGKEMVMKIVRQQIQTATIPYYGVRKGGIGYLSLSSFTENCAKEFRRAYVDMRERGIKSLVIDLRNNGGGSLSEAVEIVNMFVPKGKLVVSQKGKYERTNINYTTKSEPIDTVMPLVILVNEETASASEITAGALQDMDRATILGTRTYGKGLVQSVRDLPYNGNLKITTSHYYLPSGRCIQAINYKHERGGSREYVPDSLRREFHTEKGRIVLDGGGISPDVEIKPDSVNNIVYYLTTNGLDSTEVALDWVVDYIAKHPTIAPAGEFELTDADMDDFFEKVKASGFKYDQITLKQLNELEKVARFEGYYDASKEHFDALRKSLSHNLEHDLQHNRQVLKQVLEADIVAAYYFQAGAVENSLKYDKQMIEAEKILSEQKMED